jgi:hypothetical protein
MLGEGTLAATNLNTRGICLLQVAFLAFPRLRDVLHENPCPHGRQEPSSASIASMSRTRGA